MQLLLDVQAQVIARWQMSSQDMVRARREVAARRWQRLARCYIAQTGPLTPLQRHWVAVLNAGPDAALAGRSGAAAAGLRGWSDGLVYIIVPRGASTPPALPGVKVHWTRGEIDRHPVAAPPRVRPAAALLQASSWMGSDRAAMGVLAAGVQQRIVRPDDLRSTAVRMGELRRRRLVLQTIDDLVGGSQALSELDAIHLCRRAGLPAPTQQAVRRDGSGRRRYLDLDWDEWPLSAEIDGQQHMEVRRWCDDLLRQNELVIARGHVLRFPSLVVRTQSEVFTDQVRRALLTRGWRAEHERQPPHAAISA